MSVSLRTQSLSGIIACAGLIALGVASATTAQAAPAAVRLPNPGKTLPAKSADALFAVKRGTHLAPLGQYKSGKR